MNSKRHFYRFFWVFWSKTSDILNIIKPILGNYIARIAVVISIWMSVFVLLSHNMTFSQYKIADFQEIRI